MSKRRNDKPLDALDISFIPSGKVVGEFLDCASRRQFIMGPLGSGKTFTAAMKTLKIICEQKPGPDGVRRTAGLVTRTNMTDLEASALKDWLELTEDKFKGALGVFHYASPAHHELKFKLPDGTSVESTVWFMGLDDPDGVQKVRGMPLTFAWLNEVKDIPFSLVTMIHSRTGRYPRMEDGGPSWYGTFGDTNMPHAGHWMFEFAENTHPEGWTFFKQPGGVKKVDGEWILNKDAENLNFLPPDYYKDLLSGTSEDWIKVYLGAEYGFAMAGSPVFPEYADSTHCKEFNLVKGLPIWIGCDWGHTPAAMIGQRLLNGSWRWHSEIVTSDFGIIRFANELNRHLQQNYPNFKIAGITGDPAGVAMEGGDIQERNIFDILAASGIVAQPANTNDPTVRREAVAYFLNKMIDGQPGFLIHPQCKTARIGLAGGYKFKKVRGDIEGNVRAKPDKNMYSHVCFTAGTMISTPEGSVPIETLVTGDIVCTPIGDKQVSATMNRKASVSVYRFNRCNVTCTPDHPFFSNGGFIPADAVEYGDIIADESISWKILFKLYRFANRLNGRYMNSMAFAITENHQADITNRLAMVISIVRYGKRSTVKYLKDMMCITKMAIHQIISTTISNVCAKSNIIAIICCNRSAYCNQDSIYTKPLPVLLHGERETAYWQARSEDSVRQDSSSGWKQNKDNIFPVNDAEQSIMRSKDFQGSVHDHAYRKPGVILALMMKTGNVLFAIACFVLTVIRKLKPVHLLAKENCFQEERVYNIEVNDAHCYYANGLLVSNCEAGEYMMMGAGEARTITKRVREGKRSVECETEYNMFA